MDTFQAKYGSPKAKNGILLLNFPVWILFMLEDDQQMLIFQSDHPQAHIRPGISDQISGIILSGIDINGEGQKRLCHVGIGADGADHNDREFGQKGVGIG